MNRPNTAPAADWAHNAPEAVQPNTTPSGQMLDYIKQRLVKHAPFSEIPLKDLDCLLDGCAETYFAPNEVIVRPDDGPLEFLYYVEKGSAVGRKGLADLSSTGFQYEAGEMFPVNAFLAKRAVTATYSAREDTFCLMFTFDSVQALARKSPVFSDYLTRRTMQFLDLSRKAIQVAYSSQTLAEQTLEKPLREVCRHEPFSCSPSTPLKHVLEVMHEHRIGSMIVVNEGMKVAGILTRQDVLSRVAMAEKPLSSLISEVMNTPVHTLDESCSAQDAALLMSRFGIRHVPVTRDGKLSGIVSERDIFAMQRLSLKQISSNIHSAQDADMLRACANDIRTFAKNLLGQGIAAKQLTELISHLNDVLTERILEVVGNRMGIDPSSYCWLSFGSEGRSEQTIATDQDNGLLFVSEQPDVDRPHWLAFGKEVNQTLDQCGYPLCKGNIMASNPECCMTPAEWLKKFGKWIDVATPENLLRVNIFFDLRPLAGNKELAQPLRNYIVTRAKESTIFLRLLAENIMRFRPPLNWHGSIDTTEIEDVRTLDLKRQGTAVFVDAARFFSLVFGIDEVNTRRRFEAVAKRLSVEEQRRDAWVSAFEFLQMMRLRIQLDEGVSVPNLPDQPNVVNYDVLDNIDRRILKECFRVGRRLQQRIETEHMR
ncbi:CBS domain-containing protein [Limnobacter thiooxidans]|uniref:Nucleotidyltransferase substrate binding domain-containing protein n=1 Tax=Limnobacter thiooxidans TaxID=131080 RepID=A0AA86JFF8_9BURK|nr:CBS domain-containing protein [Limnobacter thiooxidans]BET25986.1 putative nucleotidyltransferase substrate binding domain-containing protein [Limnobacter thiooxidans]